MDSDQELIEAIKTGKCDDPGTILSNAVERGQHVIVKLLINHPDVDNVVRNHNYFLVREAVHRGNYEVVKAFLTRPDYAEMISPYNYGVVEDAALKGRTAILSLLLLVADLVICKLGHVVVPYDNPIIAILLYAVTGVRNFCPLLEIERLNINVFHSQINSTRVDCPPVVIFAILDAGRDLLGWVLTAKNTTLPLPGELVGEILGHISPLWQKIIAAMHGRPSATIGLAVADNLLKKRRFLHRVLDWYPAGY